MKFIKAREIILICDSVIRLWHKKEKIAGKKNLDAALALLGRGEKGTGRLVNDSAVINCFLWHLEDKARARSFSDSLIANIKRAIDTTNQRRNNKMEEIDALLLELLNKAGIKPSKKAGINTETPGSVVDRLAIISLKIYHMAEQVKRKDVEQAHRVKCAEKLSKLIEQRKDLAEGFDELRAGLLKGTRVLKMYFQFKMYNDPSTNPFMNK